MKIKSPTLLFLLIALTLWGHPQTALTTEEKGSKPVVDSTQQTGIDPTDIRTRFEAAYTYNERANGVTRHSTNIRLEREFTGHDMNLRLDVPITYADIPDDDAQGGIGDIGLRFNYRYKNTPGHSAVVGGTLTLDTASEYALGDDTTKLSGVWINSWRKKAWLLSAMMLGVWSESGEHDAAGVIPLVAYQPMKKYLSYISVGLPIVHDLDDYDTITLAIVRFGKVFSGGNVVYLGTRIDLSGNADDDLVVTIGYRHMF